MKTLNMMNLKNTARNLGLATLAIFAATNLAACGGSSGGSTTTTAVPYNGVLTSGYGGVGTVPAGGTSVAMSLSTMTYYGQQALQMGLNFYSYGSGLGAQGYLYTTVNWQSCGIPAGTYTVTTVQPGTLSQGVVQGQVLQASSGSGTFQIQIAQAAFQPQSQVGPDGTTFPYALQGRFLFAVNGQVCNNQLAY